jgi:predicted SPOUT superfamily RNA methylase MTH1
MAARRWLFKVQRAQVLRNFEVQMTSELAARQFRQGWSRRPETSLRVCFSSAQRAHVGEAVKLGVRATLETGPQPQTKQLPAGQLGPAQEVLSGKVVLPSEPRARTGVYWGYTVRIASGLSEVFSQCPYQV